MTSPTRAPWHDFRFVVQMPHMAPGEKLSEVELLKWIAAYQWEAIARALGRLPSEIISEQRDRLYGSVIDVELHFGDRHSLDLLGEDVEIHVRNQARFYAARFVEGLFLIDDREIPDSVVEAVKSREDLRALGGSWACMTNAFIARGGANTRLKVFKPAGAEEMDLPTTPETPCGITEQGRVQGGAEIEGVAWSDAGIPLVPRSDEPIVYPIVPESDLNGASLVYFARYEAMMNYGERIFLSQRLARPISSDLIACLSTEHRRAYFFGNASATEEVEIRVSAEALTPDHFERPNTSRYRVPFKFLFRIDLYRRSDGVLIASSLVRKSLNVPGNAKAVLNEAQRLQMALEASRGSGADAR